MPLIPITELTDPRLDAFRDLPGRRNERQRGIFVTEGDKVTQRMLAAGWEVEALLVEPRFADVFAALANPATPILVAARELMTTTVGFHFARGVMGCGRRPLRRNWTEVIPPAPAPCLVVVLPDLQDPANLATIIRTSAALGVSSVIVGPNAADVWSRRVVRVSMGAVFSIPVIECNSIEALFDAWEKDANFTTIATVVDDRAIPIKELSVPRRGAIFIGNEGHGLPPEIVDRCRVKATIDMASGIDSLNASVAAAIFLHHLSRHRQAPGLES